MRVLITGADGFVGPYVDQVLRRTCGDDIEIIATTKSGRAHPAFGSVAALDVTDEAAVSENIARLQPSHVIHLAAIAAVTVAGDNADAAWRVHVRGTRNIAHAILAHAPRCWFLHVGSGLIYGESAMPGRALDETAVLAPLDEYAVTKAAADLALGALVRRGLRVVRLRPFNHTGPGQTEAFVIPAFAMQIARIEAGLAEPVLRVGNLDAERDFLDVRDVAGAYGLVARAVDKLEPGLILNVASGVPRRVSDVLQWLLAHSRVDIAVEKDPARLRPSDLPCIVGNAGRARRLLGWTPEHTFEETLAAVLDNCRARVERAREPL